MEILLSSCHNRTIFSYYTKKTYRAFLIIILFIIITTRPAISIAQSPSAIQVTSTSGSGASGLYYATLGAAFVAINNGVHTGTVLVRILGNTTEGASVVLNASGTGSASYNSVNIQPSGGATRTISGNIAGALIDLNGADNITFDGLNTGGNALVIDNQNFIAASTIQVRADATSVTIKKCTVKGAGNSSGAVIFVSTATTLGNDNFWVDDCDITASIDNPANGFLFNSSITDNTKITNCRISDFYSNSVDAYGVKIVNLGTGCDITGNSFFQTASRTIPNIKDLYFIGTPTNAAVSNLNISDNYFGGRTVNGGSSDVPLKLNGAGGLKAISLIIGSSNTASLQNNQIKNISLTTTGTSILISLVTGSFNCGNIVGNIIGDGISGGSADLTVISAGTGTPQMLNISNNVISGITNAAVIQGIVIEKAGTSYTVSNNSIYNLNISSGGSNLTGMYLNSTTPIQNISKNTIFNLSTIGSGNVYGIDYNSGGTNTLVQRNTIYNLTTTNKNFGMIIKGINVAPSTNKVATFSNNMITLGNNVSKSIRIYGIAEATAVGCNYYNNSVYIGGIVTSDSTPVQNTAAFYSTNATNLLNIKNNIFANYRTNSNVTGTNYSIQLATNPNLAIDNNLYFGNTTSNSGYKMGKITVDYPNFCDWKAAIGAGKETNSLFKDPKFVNPSASTPDLHIQSTTPVESKGVAIAGITTDFDGDTRSSIPDIGADEGNFTLDPQVSLALFSSPVCVSGAAITLSGGSPSGGVFSGLGVSGTTFTPSVAGTGIVTITYTYNNGVDICNVSTTQNLTVTLCETRLAAKVLIEGAYNPTTGLMNDGLRTVNKIPENQPYNTLIFAGSMAYNGSEKVAPSVFTTADNNAIVDWVLIELRSATDRSIVVQRRAALLQRDGDIVDIDGVSPVKFDGLADGNYHLVIRHRLCLATRTKMTVSMTAQPIATQNPTVVDFSATNNFLSGSQKEIVTGKYGLIIGDTDRDGQINKQDINNIRAYNPSTYDSFDYLTIGYGIDFNGYIFSRDVAIVVLNNLLIQVDLGQ